MRFTVSDCAITVNLTLKRCLDFNLKQLRDFSETVSQGIFFFPFLELCFWNMWPLKYSVSISTCQDTFYDAFLSVLINPALANTWNLSLFLKLSMTLMYLIQTICWRGLKEFLLHQQTQLASSLWSHSMPCLPYFAALVSLAKALPLQTNYLPLDCQMTCWRMTLKSGQRHAYMWKQLGRWIRHCGEFEESASSTLTSESW